MLILAVVICGYAIGNYTEGDVSTEGGISIMLTFAGVMFALTAAMVILMPIFGILQNPKSAAKSLIGIAVVAVIFVVAYALSGAEPITLASGKVLDDVAELRFADVALFATYIMAGLLVVTMVGSELYKAIK